MSLISKTTVLGELQTRLSELGANTSSEDLILFLKTAQNGNVDASGVVTELTTRIGAVDTSDTLKELVVLASSLSLITSDRIVSVTSTTDLDNFTDALPGTVVLVTDTGAPYIRKSDDSWVFIDPLLQPEFLVAQPNAYAWGNNLLGKLGDNTTTQVSSPVSVVGGFTDWVQVSAGERHTVAVRANGTAWAWGNNSNGQLGDGTNDDRSSPVSVVGGYNDWVQIKCWRRHSVGLRADGTIWSWGANTSGQLGDRTTVNKNSPVSVVGGFTDWSQVSVGADFGVGLRADGTIWSWGANTSGRLGDNTTVSKSSPVSVVGGFTDWTQVSAGASFTLGLRANGTAWAWGFGSGGLLGDGTTVSKSSPVSVVGGFTDWTQVSAGTFVSLGLRSNGTAWAWGYNSFGQLGDNTTVNKNSPVSVVGGFTDWTQLSAGKELSLGVRANGTAWAWGNGQFGRLGNAASSNTSSPVSVVGGFTDWTQVSAGEHHSLGIRGG